MQNSEPTIVKAPCCICLGSKNHTVLHEHHWQDEHNQGVDALLKCNGCGEVSLAKQTIFIADGVKETEYYPSPISRSLPRWATHWIILANDTQADVAQTMLEVYRAVAGKQYRLAAMGIRAAIERLMISTVGDLPSFPEKMDAFEKSGAISLLQRKALAETLELGHAAMHRGYAPSEDDLQQALDIVEGICASIFEHEYAAKKLAKRVPRRAPRGKA